MKLIKKYSGVVVPMVSPLTEQMTIDEKAVESMLYNFSNHQVQPFILGTTGEAASLTTQQKHAYIKILSINNKYYNTSYVGISSNSLQETIDNAKFCADNNIDVVVATVPSYYALTEIQILNYFTKLADASPCPVIIYNIPATTHCSLSLPLLFELSKHDNIVGIKDSERNEERLQESIAHWKDDKDCSFFVGWAAKSNVGLSLGADGIIPSSGNVDCHLYELLYNACVAEDESKSNYYQQLSDELGNIYQANKTLGESIWALKKLMQQKQICNDIVAPPLTAMDEQTTMALIEAYKLYEKNAVTNR